MINREGLLLLTFADALNARIDGAPQQDQDGITFITTFPPRSPGGPRQQRKYRLTPGTGDLRDVTRTVPAADTEPPETASSANWEELGPHEIITAIDTKDTR